MSRPAPSEATTYPPAELDRRFYAFTVDRLVAWGLFAGTSYVAYRVLIEPGNLAGGIGLVVGAVLVVSLAFSLLLGLAGTSPGKALLGLRVVAAETGSPIGVGRALLRSTVLGVAALPTFGIGVASLAWTAVMDRGEQRRGWHDLVTHGVVVDVRPAPDQEEVAEERPRQVVNLTAMRLVPAAPTPAPVAPTPPAAPASSDVPSWRVRFDTGEELVVEGLALVGRRPEARAGERVSHLVPLGSSDMSLSKTHAQLQVTPAGALVVMDRGSTNGSVVIRQGVSKALTPGRPTTLLAGDAVCFGDRRMTVGHA